MYLGGKLYTSANTLEAKSIKVLPRRRQDINKKMKRQSIILDEKAADYVCVDEKAGSNQHVP